MGCGVSKKVVVERATVQKDASTSINTRDWKLLLSSTEAKKKFIEDGTLTTDMEPGHLELRTMLDDPISLKALGEYASAGEAKLILLCWMDIQGYKSITSGNYRRSTALNIYHTYIADASVLTSFEVSDLDRLTYHATLKMSKSKTETLQPNLFDKVQRSCFESMYQQIFIPFKGTPQYADLCAVLKERYNKVAPEDFEYYNKLGEGGFGFVVHCKKISTGKHYAMKIQRKVGLVNSYKTRPHKIDFEKQAFAICQHPFIVSMDYAFQTQSLAIMVLELDTCGDLHYVSKLYPERRLPKERMQFFAAEIFLALSYMHSLGLVYRDLKPQNVLVSETGHVQLADLGGVMDISGELLGQSSELDAIPLIAKQFHAGGSEKSGGAGNRGSFVGGAGRPSMVRAHSVMGTMGYMAPEMMDMLSKYNQRAADGKAKTHHYTTSVDWWSLGVLLFKLLTGGMPFDERQLRDYISPEFNKTSLHNPLMKAAIPFPPYVDQPTRDLITGFLDPNPSSRLGSGEGGDEDIRCAAYFGGVDWNLLEQKKTPPPVKPTLYPVFQGELPVYASLGAVLEKHSKADWLVEVPDQSTQQHFKAWDFTSAHTIRVEAGLSHASDQYSRNDKIQELMGKSTAASSAASATRPAEPV